MTGFNSAYVLMRRPSSTNSSRTRSISKAVSFRSAYAAEVANAIGSTIEGSSFSGLLTRVEIGHIRMGVAGNGRIRSRGSGSSL